MAANFFSMGLFLLVTVPATSAIEVEQDVVTRSDNVILASVQVDPQDPTSQRSKRSDRREAPTRRRPEVADEVRNTGDRETVVIRLGHVPAVDTAKSLSEWLELEQNRTNKVMATVVPVIVSNSLLVTASPDQLKTIAQVIEQLDQPVAQIRIKSVLLKLIPKDSDEGNISTMEGLPKGSIKEILAELKNRFNVRIIAQPGLLAVDNTPAMIQLGGRIPRVTGTAVSARGRTNSVSMENVGTIFQTTCRVSKDDRITLEIELESSEMGPKEEGVVIAESPDAGPIKTPVVETVTLQTTATALNGEVVILGGMVYHSGERRGEVLLLLQPEIVK